MFSSIAIRVTAKESEPLHFGNISPLFQAGHFASDFGRLSQVR